MPIHDVLIVDDSKTELAFLSEVLTKAGYAVTTAESAEAAQRHLARAKPDLILLDVIMPGQNGFKLTRTLTKDPRYADVPIILCTSKAQATDRIWGLRQGARAYLVKPVGRAELLKQIRALG